MKTRPKRNFSPEFRIKSAQLVVEQNYSIRQAAEAINVGLWTNGFVSCAKRATVKTQNLDAKLAQIINPSREYKEGEVWEVGIDFP